jgi:F-type H+-transporting ATPase subunit b
MDEVLHAFGIDWRLVVIQVFNFTLMIAVLWYFLYTPILSVINEREQKIKKGVEDAELASKKLTEADSEKATILQKAHGESESIVLRAKGHANEKGAAIITDAEQRSERILQDAKNKAEELKVRAHKESEAEIAKVAILAAEEILKQKT